MQSSEKMAVNTAILYLKLIVTIAINLFSTRLILSSLGVEDYGIVNLISGIVAMLSFLQNSMTVSTQRFLSVGLGHNDLKNQKVLFNNSVVLHILLALVLILILESCYPLVFKSAIQIPYNRIKAAGYLYQLMIVATSLVVITVPYDASLNAHENMLWYSIACIIESFIKLFGAIVLLKYHGDKLVFYGLLIVSIRLISMLIKVLYCKYHYEDTHLSLKLYNKFTMKDMFSFSLWNLFGAFAWVARGQGISIVLNIFGGVIINAAYGISHQVSGQLSNFSATITKAMAPQIMMSKGMNNKDRMVSLSLKQSKYAFILLTMLSLPLYIDMEFVLSLWLKEVPEYSIMFCRLAILVALLQQVSSGLMTLIQANGNIRDYQICVSIVLLMCIPFSYFVLKLGLSIYSVFYVLLGIELLALIVRIIFTKHLIRVDYLFLFKELIMPILLFSFVQFVLIFLCLNHFIDFCNTSFYSFVIHAIFIELSIFLGSFLIFNKQEKGFVLSFIRKIKR